MTRPIRTFSRLMHHASAGEMITELTLMLVGIPVLFVVMWVAI